MKRNAPPNGRGAKGHNHKTDVAPLAEHARKAKFPPPGVVVRQLMRDLRFTCGVMLPDDDAGRDDARLMVGYLAHLHHGTIKAVNFLDVWCPWMGKPERELLLQDAALSAPPHYTADQLAERRGVTYHRRQQLRHTVIGAIDVPKAERERLRKERDKERSRRRRERQRRAKGKATPAVPRRGLVEHETMGAGRRVAAYLGTPSESRSCRDASWDRSTLTYCCGPYLRHRSAWHERRAIRATE